MQPFVQVFPTKSLLFVAIAPDSEDVRMPRATGCHMNPPQILQVQRKEGADTAFMLSAISLINSFANEI